MNTDKKEYGISVIIPCYNTEQYVEETLKSVLNQSFKDYEIICLNDGSTDGTLEILKRYQQSYPNIRVISSENHGSAYQRNTGVQCAQGKYIYYMTVMICLRRTVWRHCISMQKQTTWMLYILRQIVSTKQKKLRKHFLNFLHYTTDIKNMMVFMMEEIYISRWRMQET